MAPCRRGNEETRGTFGVQVAGVAEGTWQREGGTCAVWLRRHVLRVAPT